MKDMKVPVKFGVVQNVKNMLAKGHGLSNVENILPSVFKKK